MAASLSSFGIKHHPQGQSWPWGARTCLDVRHFRNPYMFKGKTAMSGRDHRIGRYIEEDPHFPAKYAALLAQVRQSEGCVALYCVGGQHRSVWLAEKLSRDLRLPPPVHIDLIVGGE